MPHTAMLADTLAANDTPLTSRTIPHAGLPCVASMDELNLRLSRHLALCRRASGLLAVLWVEVELLDQPGAAPAAELLQAAGLRLRNRVRGSDEVVQVAGLGFAVLLHAAGASAAELVEQRLRQALTPPYGLAGGRHYLGVRLGRALFPDAGHNGRMLAEAACRDLALRQAG